MRKVRIAQAGVSLIHANMYRDTLMLLPDETGDTKAQPSFVPNAFALVGVTYHFDAPQ